ncbi:FxsA family protein [Streptomyces sp. RB6PN25]|uniref:FxsA family protein n=1 Tax=Streptomyces humicola TaxID=2953240 RepID=A0ABT1PR03_9ACTN|nr:FxsA family membrane protein [Streptomyces humicola]MCQ4080094.1 FxsA family protein [Streptomyces humicola]
MTFGSPSPDPGRSRARILVPLVVAAWAVLEIWLLTVVAGALGGGMVLLLLLAGAVCGAAAVKRAGLRAWQSLTASVQAGGEGGRGSGATGAGLGMLGGLLLIVPGFVSDAAGLLCLFPPTRRLLTGVAGKVLARRRPRPGSLGDAFQQVRIHRPDGKVVQGEVIRDDEPAGRGEDDARQRSRLMP